MICLVIYTIFKGEGLYLILLFSFVVIAAAKEKKMAAFIFIKEVISKKKLLKDKKVLKTQILVCMESVTLKSLMDSFLPRRYHIIIVIDKDGNKIDTIYEEEILNAIIKYGFDIKIEKLLII